MKWPLRKRAWKWLHDQVNGLAWRYNRHWLWRLNDWIAPHWSEWWIKNHRRLR